VRVQLLKNVVKRSGVRLPKFAGDTARRGTRASRNCCSRRTWALSPPRLPLPRHPRDQHFEPSYSARSQRPWRFQPNQPQTCASKPPIAAPRSRRCAHYLAGLPEATAPRREKIWSYQTEPKTLQQQSCAASRKAERATNSRGGSLSLVKRRASRALCKYTSLRIDPLGKICAPSVVLSPAALLAPHSAASRLRIGPSSTNSCAGAAARRD
jgi:hypothetical protein